MTPPPKFLSFKDATAILKSHLVEEIHKNPALATDQVALRAAGRAFVADHPYVAPKRPRGV